MVVLAFSSLYFYAIETDLRESSVPKNYDRAILMLFFTAVVRARIVQCFALFYGRFLRQVFYAHLVHRLIFDERTSFENGCKDLRCGYTI